MAEQSGEKEAVAAFRRACQEAVDLALFISDELEMGRLSTRDGASALRMFAGLMSLTKQVS